VQCLMVIERERKPSSLHLLLGGDGSWLLFLVKWRRKKVVNMRGGGGRQSMPREPRQPDHQRRDNRPNRQFHGFNRCRRGRKDVFLPLCRIRTEEHNRSE
jgi:hypothetical protein